MTTPIRIETFPKERQYRWHHIIDSLNHLTRRVSRKPVAIRNRLHY